MSYSAIQIANFFLARHGPIYKVELQKLLYFAHGWYLGLTDQALINEEPEAWQLGPVFPTLYHARKSIKSNAATIPNETGAEIVVLPQAVEEFLEKIYQRYGQLYGGQMTALTHRVGSPWHQIADKHLSDTEDLPHGLTIPNSLIRDSYKKMVEDEQG
ncbi:MAG: Panacea domain-containing protein [Gammaproteobacteria bacterium]